MPSLRLTSHGQGTWPKWMALRTNQTENNFAYFSNLWAQMWTRIALNEHFQKVSKLSTQSNELTAQAIFCIIVYLSFNFCCTQPSLFPNFHKFFQLVWIIICVITAGMAIKFQKASFWLGKSNRLNIQWEKACDLEEKDFRHRKRGCRQGGRDYHLSRQP